MNYPSVSVVIPCYNDGRTLTEAVASVKTQSGQFVLSEIIVVNDRSEDPLTCDVLEKLRQDPQIKVVANRFSKGPGGARNTGIKLVRGDWVAFLDADDFLLPGSIDARVTALINHPHIKWCGGDFAKLYPDGTYSKPVYQGGGKASSAFNGYHFDRPLLLRKPIVYFLEKMITWIGCVIISTNVLQKLKGFRETLLHGQDNNLFIRIAIDHDFIFIPNISFVRRIRSDSHTRQEYLPKEWPITNFKSLLKDTKFLPYEGLIKKKISGCYRDNYRFLLARHRYFQAFWHFCLYKVYRYRAKSASRRARS